MESYEASRTVFSRVQSIDPENASKIMGYILLHHDEKDVIHLAYGPETLIVSLINKAKTDLGLSSNTLSAPMASPTSNPIAISRPNPLSISLSSPRLPNNGYNPSSPSSPSIWSAHHHSVSPNNNNNNLSFNGAVANNTNYLEDYHLQDSNFTPFMETPHGLSTFWSDYMRYPYGDNSSNSSDGENNPQFHRRSSSFNDSMYFGTDDSTSGFGFKPCLYYSGGFCKNGSSCKFVHGGGGGCNGGFSDDNCGHIVGSPCDYDGFEQCQEELLRSKLAQQHRLAQLMANGVNLPYNKFNFLHNGPHRSATAALLMGDEFHKLNRVRMARNEFYGMDCNPSSRQIYLTFPADSTFKEEDVSSYFNRYGPVQDVRIPYQQKRMFGFVTFVYPETVKIILAIGNPHFVCDSRVLVKPYKEKGKLPDKKHNHQPMDRGEFCSSPSGHDCGEPFDFQLGGRMVYSSQEMLLRKKLELEQADLQHALVLQEQRLMNLQLLDMKNQHNVPAGTPIPSPDLPLEAEIKIASQSSSGISQDVSEAEKDDVATSGSNGNFQKEEDSTNGVKDDIFDSLEHVLPDNLFASPKKLGTDFRPAAFSPALGVLDNGAAQLVSSSTSSEDSAIPATSSLAMAPLKSCFFEMPGFSTGHGTLGM